MKICKNCSTINDNHQDRCVKCKMPGQLVPYEGPMAAEKKKIKTLYAQCSNCGTMEHGSGSKCAVCNFPLKLQKSDQQGKEDRSADQKTNLK